jgi:hypothetical protein
VKCIQRWSRALASSVCPGPDLAALAPFTVALLAVFFVVFGVFLVTVVPRCYLVPQVYVCLASLR